MNTREAHAIFTDIESKDYTDEEKGEAILQIVQMPTHMSVTKDAMLKVIRWLLDLAFDIPEDPHENTEPRNSPVYGWVETETVEGERNRTLVKVGGENEQIVDE